MIEGWDSISRVMIERPHGESLWSYMFEQYYNLDIAVTSEAVTIRPVLPLANESDVELPIGINLPIGPNASNPALSPKGSFVMYDPQTFKGDDLLTRTQMTEEDLIIDGFVIASIVMPWIPDSAEGYVMGWHMKNSKVTKDGDWKMLKFEGVHPCATDTPPPTATVQDTYWCKKGGGSDGGAFGKIGGVLYGLLSFEGSNDLSDVRHDLCAGLGDTKTGQRTRSTACTPQQASGTATSRSTSSLGSSSRNPKLKESKSRSSQASAWAVASRALRRQRCCTTTIWQRGTSGEHRVLDH